jgi:hypothetical protein
MFVQYLSRRLMIVLYDRPWVVSKENLPFVYWEGKKHVMKLFP